MNSMMHITLVFETEQRCILKDWKGVLASIDVRAIPPCIDSDVTWYIRKLHNLLG